VVGVTLGTVVVVVAGAIAVAAAALAVGIPSRSLLAVQDRNAVREVVAGRESERVDLRPVVIADGDGRDPGGARDLRSGSPVVTEQARDVDRAGGETRRGLARERPGRGGRVDDLAGRSAGRFRKPERRPEPGDVLLGIDGFEFER
jgi:hypothetical protein